ncbi:arylamine N-acetyltransferase [soil metagenome]
MASLERLGLSAETPSVPALFELHRAHVERIPYETTWIHLGERWSIDVDAAIERIALRGRGGYCFHLNGSFARLLTQLGYDVTLHIGGVHRGKPAAGDMTNHLVLLVSGLSTDANPNGQWYVDAGLGDALFEPLPLREGTYIQAPMTFVLTETPGGVGDWHLAHDVRGSFAGMSFQRLAVSLAEFEDRHHTLSTSPDSVFVRTVSVQRRKLGEILVMRSLTFTSLTNSRTEQRVVSNRGEWFALLADEFLLRFDGVSPNALDRLWNSATAAHRAFLAKPLSV